MDATSNIHVNRSATLTGSPVASRKTASDSYVRSPPICNINGVVSDIKTPASLSPLKAGEYLDGLYEAYNIGAPVSLKERLDREETHNWYITSINPRQDTENGFMGVSNGVDGTSEISQSFKISVELEQVIFARGVQSVEEPDPAFSDLLSNKQERNSVSKNFDNTLKEQNELESLEARRAALQSRYTSAVQTAFGT